MTVNYFTLKTASAASWPGTYSAASDGPPKVSPITVWTPLAAVFGLLIGSLVTAWFGYIGHSRDLGLVTRVDARAPAYQGIFSLFGKQPAGRARHQFVRASRRGADRGWEHSAPWAVRGIVRRYERPELAYSA